MTLVSQFNLSKSVDSNDNILKIITVVSSLQETKLFVIEIIMTTDGVREN